MLSQVPKAVARKVLFITGLTVVTNGSESNPVYVTVSMSPIVFQCVHILGGKSDGKKEK